MPRKTVEDCIYLKKDDGVLKLKRNHNYYYQVMMHLAVTGLTWCFFFVWHCDNSHLEVIEFDADEWQGMKNRIDAFYFDYFLE